MSKPSQIEIEAPQDPPPTRRSPVARPVRQVVVDPEDIFPKPPTRRASFPLEVVVSRYLLLSGVIVATLVALLTLSEFLWRS